MSAMKNRVKEIIESSKSEEELLNNLDSLNRPLTNEELNFVSGGDGRFCKLDACGSIADDPEVWQCVSPGCSTNIKDICTTNQDGNCSKNTDDDCFRNYFCYAGNIHSK